MFIDQLHIVLVSEGREILAVCGWSSNLKLLGLGRDFVSACPSRQEPHLACLRREREVRGRYHTMHSNYQWIEAEIQNLKSRKASIEEVEGILGHGSRRMQTGTPKHKVGFQTMLNTELEELAKMGEGGAIRGISVMGGIGKPTLAKEVYNHYSQENTFEFQTFLELGKEADMVTLQRQVLNDLLQKKGVENVGEKYNSWFLRLIGQLVLIVIDDILKMINSRNLY